MLIDEGDDMTDTLNLIETIAKEPKFSTFSRYMGITNANSVFSRPGQFTVFVPTNDAFAKIPDDQMNAMLNEPGTVGRQVIQAKKNRDRPARRVPDRQQIGPRIGPDHGDVSFSLRHT